MRNRTHQMSDSSVMLLDTMCNLFGCLMIILMLVALVQRIASAVADAPSSRSPEIAKHQTLQSKELRLLDKQIMQLRTLLGSNTNTVVREGLREMMAAMEAAESERDSLRQRIQTTRQEIERRKAELASLAAETQQLRKQLASITQRHRAVRVPFLHGTDKTAVLTAVQGGKFFPITDVSQGYVQGYHRGHDATAVDQRGSPDARSRMIGLRSQAGQPVREGAEAGGALRNLLRNVDKNQEFVSVAVYPDSYAEFNYIKGLLVAAGIDYYWLPMEDAEPIVIISAESGEVL